MKKILLLLPILLFQCNVLFAQTFQEGVELYESEQYEEALVIFQELDSDEAILFTGKSYLALGSYPKASHFFERAEQSTNRSIAQEAQYSRAVVKFRTKDYSGSLNTLYRLIESQNRTGIQVDARRLYSQIIRYLDISERFEALQKAESPAIRLDIVLNSRRQLDPVLYQSLEKELFRLEADTTYHDDLREALQNNQNQLSSSFSYPSAPEGTVYHVGVVLPTFEENDPDFTIPRNLYFGMMLAADEFNSSHSDKKVRLIFKDSHENTDSTAAAITELAWAEKADAVIGPLFSEPARRMAQLSEEYQIPMLAPLANSDELNLDYNYTFQLNPTFAVHGINMARFAVQELGLDTLAVITEKDAFGRDSALAFRKEAERLGAHISYYFEDDFASQGYDLSDYTKVFTPDKALADSLGYTPSQAIYAPFTGQAASTLTNLFMNDLEAMRARPIILGSEEWSSDNLSAYQQRTYEIYRTQSSDVSADSSKFAYFEEDFETRFNTEPDHFARVGYDTATFLFESLETAGNPSYLTRVMRNKDTFDGLGMRILFDGKRINQLLGIHPLTPAAEERLSQSR
ncbi:ABC transporter substrate-binding protein [Rhodohalobacter halophilus]|uniref:ABC transporter substrate-binding protein n=1 Tax=Rhodohalobacter halophilus TaxID=1812810 RepID=UPI00083F8BEE|nr:ABC transporter substrate-binding protein [Rhodohalobacter halophilus]